MNGAVQREQFTQLVMPHLDAAYNLALWLVRNPQDAEDLAQEAMLRAVRFFDGFRGGDPRAWLLTIVRHTCYSWLRRNRPAEAAEAFDEEAHSGGAQADASAGSTSAMMTTARSEYYSSPEAQVIAQSEAGRLRLGLDSLPLVFREAVVLRELEGMSYKEIAEISGVSIGTVMSRIARGRERLRQALGSPPAPLIITEAGAKPQTKAAATRGQTS